MHGVRFYRKNILFKGISRPSTVHTRGRRSKEVKEMSPKDLMYIEDALGHEKFLKTQCQEAVQNLQDGELKNCVQQLMNKHQQLFDSFYQLV